MGVTSANFYPSYLVSYLTKLTGFSSTSIKIWPANQQNAIPYNEIVVTLPSDQLLTPSSFAMLATLNTSGTTKTAGSGSCVLPPAGGCEKLFSNVRMSVNGQLLSSGPINSYHHLFSLLKDYQLGQSEVERSPLNCGAQNPGTGTGNSTTNQTPLINQERYVLQSGTDATVQPYIASNMPISVWNWLGPLNSPELLDTSVYGEIKIHLTLADPGVLLTHNATNANYSLSNIRFVVDTVTLPQEFFANQAAYLQQPGRVIKRLMPEWSVYQGPIIPANQTPTGHVQFSPVSDSVDMLIGSFRNVYPTSDLGCYNENKALACCGLSTGDSDYFQRCASSVKSWQFNLNGALLPQYQPNARDEAFYFAMQWSGGAHDQVGCLTSYCTTLDRFQQAHFIAPVRLAPSADPDVRLVSGLPTRNTAYAMRFEFNGDGTFSSSSNATGGGYAGMTREPVVYVMCSSVLNAQAGKLITLTP